MKAKEFISELVTRANTTEHLLKRLKYAAQLCQQMGDTPLLFREFETGIPYETVLAKVINTTEKEGARSPKWVKGGHGKAEQIAILDKLGMQNPVFTKMGTPSSTFGRHGDPHIFIPMPGAKAVWSPRVIDLGGLHHIDDQGKPQRGGTHDIGRAFTAHDLDNADKWAATYHHGVPTEFTDHEIIFDCDYYYLLNVQSFLNRFSGRENKAALVPGFSKRVEKIDPLVWSGSIRTYADVAHFLLKNGIGYVKWYQDNVEKKQQERSAAIRASVQPEFKPSTFGQAPNNTTGPVSAAGTFTKGTAPSNTQ